MTDTTKLAALDADYANLGLFLASYVDCDDRDTLTDVIGLDDDLLTIGALRRINAYRDNALVPRADLDEAVAMLEQCYNHEYNPFEPDNQTQHFNLIAAFHARHTQEAERG